MHAIKVWKTFKLKDMGEYHDLHLKSDVLLLSDVLKTLERLVCNIMDWIPVIISQVLDCLWDAMLKMTDIKLELITDVDTFQFIEKGMIAKRVQHQKLIWNTHKSYTIFIMTIL